MSGYTLSNWGHTAGSNPYQTVVPTNVAGLKAAVVAAAAADPPRRVRPMGHRHSVTPCFEADGEIQIDMSRFGHTVAPVVDGLAKTITVQAGITMLQVRDALAPYRLELPVSPEIGNATAGSLACSGTKDGSIRGRAPGIGQVASSVIEVKIVDAGGHSRVLSGASLQAFRSSHGLMGIVHEVTFQAIDRDLLQIEYEWVSLQPVPTRQRVFTRADGQQADGVLAFIQPYAKRLLVERRTRLVGDHHPAPDHRDRLKRAIRDWIWEWGETVAVGKAAGLEQIAQVILAALPFVPGADIPPEIVPILRSYLDTVLDGVALVIPADGQDRWNVPAITEALAAQISSIGLGALSSGIGDVYAAIPWTTILGGLGGGSQQNILFDLVDRSPVLLEVLGGYRAHRSDSMIDFSAGDVRWPYVFDFTFWAFPQSRWREIVTDYLAFCEEFYSAPGGGIEPGYRPSIFSEVYFIDQDQHSWLSFSPDEPIFTINMVDSPRNFDGVWRWDDRWFEMNRRFNLWATVLTNASGQTRRGRPILNQTKELHATPHVLAKAFGTEWTRFADEVRLVDPAGRFRTQYFRSLGL